MGSAPWPTAILGRAAAIRSPRYGPLLLTYNVILLATQDIRKEQRMNRLHMKVMTCLTGLCLLMVLSVGPAFAKPQAKSDDQTTSTSKKKKKKSKKEAASASNNSAADNGSTSEKKPTGKKSRKKKKSDAGEMAAQPTPSDNSVSESTSKKSRRSKRSDRGSMAAPGSTSTAAPSSASSASAPPATTAPSPAPAKSSTSKPASTGGASSPEIAAAQSSGKVWVNLDSGVYHKSGRWYGKTKNGKFMTEDEAKRAGYRESQKD